MTPAIRLEKVLLEKCVNWFLAQYRESVVQPIESQFPSFRLPAEIQLLLNRTQSILDRFRKVGGHAVNAINVDKTADLAADPDELQLLKQIILRYRRWRAAETED